jgi:hypothetical protein
MPKISESQATKLLEDNCGAPRGTMQGNRGSQINRSKHRRLVMAVASQSVKLMDLSERWAAGTPTEAELKAAISSSDPYAIRRHHLADLGVANILVGVCDLGRME